MSVARGLASSCSWCSHQPHAGPCNAEIQTGTTRQPNTQPCPCNNTKENTHVQQR